MIAALITAGWSKEFMLYRRTMFKRSISAGLLLVFLKLIGSAWGQGLPRDEQQFCSAFPALRTALKQAHADSTGDSPRQQRQLKQAVSAATKGFKRSAGWKSSSQPARRWLGDLYSIAESTTWGHYVGASVKLRAGMSLSGFPNWLYTGGLYQVLIR